jgi:polysaccharide pyruvyl transferase CsaB
MKIVIAGNYGVGNLGDEMILKGLLQTLRNAVPFAELTVLSGNPEETARRHYVKTAEKFPAGFRSLVKMFLGMRKGPSEIVKECDYFILGGGGLFGGLKKRANIIWGIQAMMAYFYNKPVIMYGQSIGPLKGWFVKKIVKNLFKKAKTIILRDQKSKDRLSNIGISKEKINVFPDLAFGFKNENTASNKQKKLVVALREMKGITPKFKESIAGFLNWLINENKWQVTFITFQTGIGSDDPLHEEIRAMIVDKPYVEIISEHNIDHILQNFAEAEMVLGMRLHAIVSAIKTKTPFIAINYAPKVKDFLASSSLDSHMLNVKEINAARLREQFDLIQSEKENITSNLLSFNENASQEHKKMEEYLKTIFRNA